MEKRLMKKMIRKFPIGTLVRATIPRVGEKPYELLGLVISHVRLQSRIIGDDDRCEVWFGPNPWMSSHIVAVMPGRLKSVSRTYTKDIK